MSGLDWPGAVSDVKAAVVGLKAAGCTKVCLFVCASLCVYVCMCMCLCG